MIGSLLPLLLSIQAPAATAAAVPSLSERYPPSRPGMVYDPVTETYLPAIGWTPPNARKTQQPTGPQMHFYRAGQKIGEVPVRR
jgi:hypothetical protein